MRVGVLAIFASFALLALPLTAAAGPAQDSDSDGTYDVLDFCSMDNQAPNPCGLDADTDGFGNHCDGDFTQDGVVNASDFGPFSADLAAGIDSGIGSDMDCNGVVNATDFGLFAGQLSQGFPGPSGLSCAGTSPCP